MIKRTATKPGATVGADKATMSKVSWRGVRALKVTPHVSQKDKGSAIDRRTTRHAGYKTSLKIRKRIEEVLAE